MAKRRISAKEAASDIRAGMDDPGLMKKYGLSSAGLQSLLDKLVQAGFIDLGEVQNRLPGVLGTVVVSESLIMRVKKEDKDGRPQLKAKSAPLINAQEAARDIRLGMNDHGLMQKYRLSPKGLKNMFEKLVSAGLITQIDIDRWRHLDTDHTIDLKEEKLSFSDALKQLGLDNRNEVKQENPPASPAVARGPEPRKLEKPFPQPDLPIPNKNGQKTLAASPEKARKDARGSERVWHDSTPVVLILLITLFPLGLYALYRNISLSQRTKALILLLWAALAVAAIAVLITEML
jgi:hypothetical protein